ncbi:ROK family protein [Planctomycetota bacterium]
MSDSTSNSKTNVAVSQALPLFVGVDVGGTSIKFGLVDDTGKTLSKCHIPTDQEKGPEDAMRRSTAVMLTLAESAGVTMDDVLGVGLATPGTMDLDEGTLLQPHNLPGWWEFPIRDCLQAICGKPVHFANDANAAAFGEFWIGSGAAFNSIVLFTLGTGVGGGIIIDDTTLVGENSAGSELGHTIIDYKETARLCGCGQRGHLEAYASARGVVARTEDALASGRESSLAERIKEGKSLTPLLIAREAELGDELSREIVLWTARYLGIGTVNIMHTVNPGAVIFGGAMTFGGHDSELGRQFLDTIRKETHSRCFPALVDKTHIDFATLGGDAGYVGAAGLARLAYASKR